MFELICDATISTPWGGETGLGRESCQSKKFRDHLISSLDPVAIINCGLMREVDSSRGTAREWQSQKCLSPLHPSIHLPRDYPSLFPELESRKVGSVAKALAYQRVCRSQLIVNAVWLYFKCKGAEISRLAVTEGSQDHGETPVSSRASLRRPTGFHVSSPGCAEGYESCQR